jgi:hypothetical protein
MSTHFIPTLQFNARRKQTYLYFPKLYTKSRAAQLIASALAEVYNLHIPVNNYPSSWYEDDYNVAKTVAMGINRGSFDVENLKWHGRAAGMSKDGTNRIQWFQVVIPALAAYVNFKKVELVEVGWKVDKVLAQLDDSRAYVASFLGADNEAHPMFEFLKPT